MQTAVSTDVQEMMSGRNWSRNGRELAHADSPARSQIPRGCHCVEPVVRIASVNGMRGEMMMMWKWMKRGGWVNEKSGLAMEC